MLLNKEILIGIYDFVPTNIVWTGLGSDNNWSTNANWNVKAPVAYDSLQFAGTTRLAPFNDLTIDTPLNGIAFNVGSGAFTLTGNRFVLNSGSITNNSSNNQTINNDIVLGANAGTINCNTGTIGIRGNISGSGSLTKIGTTTLQLSGNNTYTGNTYISGGFISVGNNNAVGTGTVYIGNQNFAINVNSIPSNTIINNRIFMNAGTIAVNKTSTFNGLVTYGPTNTTNTITLGNNATLTINGGISGLPGVGTLRTGGLGTYVLSTVPLINDSTLNFIAVGDSGTETFIIAVSGNRFQNISTGSYIRTDVPLAINDDSVVVSANGRSGKVDLNGNSQAFRNMRTSITVTSFQVLSANNIFNNSSTFASLTANNTANTTYTGSISGNINLIKTGTSALTLSGSTALGIGPRYTGFTAISAGSLINYALSSNPSDKVNFAQFTPTTLTVNFATPPTVGDAFILLPGRTINSYPSVSLVNAAGRIAAYNSTTSTLSVTA